MESTDLNVILTLITVILFLIYGVMRYFRTHIKRPTFLIIDTIYNRFYDVCFKEINSSGQYLLLDKLYSTMSYEFKKANISDDEVKNYINYLDKKSGQYWFLPVITALTSFIGINNMESMKKVLENVVATQKNNHGVMGNLVNQAIEKGSHLGFWGIAILTLLIVFLFFKTIFGDNLNRNVKESWKKTILKDYIDYPRSEVKFNFHKLQQSRKILDFLSDFNLNKRKNTISFKEDNLIKIKIDNRCDNCTKEIKYYKWVDCTKDIEYSGKPLDIYFRKKVYRVLIILMDDGRNIIIRPFIYPDVDLEFIYLCAIRNTKMETISQKSYSIPILGRYYRKIDTYEREGKKFRKLGCNALFFICFLIVYFLILGLIVYGGILLPVIFAIYILSDFLTTKMFDK